MKDLKDMTSGEPSKEYTASEKCDLIISPK